MRILLTGAAVTSERAWPLACVNSRELIERYGINIAHCPEIPELGEGAARIGYAPRRHFGTFLDELRRSDAQGGEAAVRDLCCSYGEST